MWRKPPYWFWKSPQLTSYWGVPGWGQHNPILSWSTGEVLKWGETCFPDCFPDLPVPHSPLPTPLPVQATSIESPSVHQPLQIPACYAPFSDVFCPKRASKLASPAKDTALLTCFRVNQCPGEGSIPCARGGSFKTIANITHPLTSLLRKKPKSLAWSPAAEKAFNLLKRAFTTAPLLVHPDPPQTLHSGSRCIYDRSRGQSCLSSRGTRAASTHAPSSPVNSTRRREIMTSETENCWLSNWPSRNGGTGWREPNTPFTVLTDHKNLEYLRAAKRLNPRQARWALFFTRFNFTISYRPGSKNTKAGALSRMFAPEESPETPEPILPENIFVSPITPGTPTALETAELLFNHVFRYFGIPEDIVSDRGPPKFISRVWKAFLTRLGVAVSLSSGSIRKLTGRWRERSRRSAATSVPSAIATRAHGASTWVGPTEPSDVPAVDHWFRESERVWDSAHHQLQQALHRRRRTADLRRSDSPAFQPGQKVWLSTRDIRLRLPCRKLSPRFIGPFTILKQINPVTYKLLLPPEPGGGAAEPPLPLLLDDGTAYKVKEILDSRHRGGRLEYLVDWEGYGPEERSWGFS
ncbi:hypothetical protein QTP70_016446 [Hemibagrus guttatus]|uniref:Chromo domain-containing protein n=1 Tax=Hemibagrus guttatus TaxID=175788 RepID=A0AAE0R7Y1_9TELE|nr:hypothetical protein QTP70_016446 [Hemibagrus guttatus]